ncbi:MAG: carbamoyl-phosphate synthase large subunit, partial [Nitrososphaerota archaeon]
TEDRERFRAFLSSLWMTQPLGHAVKGVEEAVNTAASIGYPVLVRPSYVLGGRAMSIVWSEEELRRYIDDAISASEGKPILIDKYLYPAVEVDVDALSDGEDVFICGVLEHIELAGVHSGDAAMVIPPRSLSQKALERIKEYTKALALNLKVLGLINIQYAVMGDEVYVLEVNARASRTVPFLSKVINVPIAKVATKLMMGRRLRELNLPAEASHPFVAVKESVFSFSKLPAVDPMLEPRMKSTGECMGIGRTFEEAYWKAELAANNPIPLEGCVLLAAEGAEILEASITSELKSMGYRLLLLCVDDDCRELAEKIGAENVSGHLFMDEVDAAVELRKRGVVMVVDLGWWRRTSVGDVGYMLRRAAVMTGIPYITTPQGISAALKAARWARSTNTSYMSLNELQCCSTSYLRFSTQ